MLYISEPHILLFRRPAPQDEIWTAKYKHVCDNHIDCWPLHSYITSIPVILPPSKPSTWITYLVTRLECLYPAPHFWFLVNFDCVCTVTVFFIENWCLSRQHTHGNRMENLLWQTQTGILRAYVDFTKKLRWLAPVGKGLQHIILDSNVSFCIITHCIHHCHTLYMYIGGDKSVIGFGFILPFALISKTSVTEQLFCGLLCKHDKNVKCYLCWC